MVQWYFTFWSGQLNCVLKLLFFKSDQEHGAGTCSVMIMVDVHVVYECPPLLIIYFIIILVIFIVKDPIDKDEHSALYVINKVYA